MLPVEGSVCHSSSSCILGPVTQQLKITCDKRNMSFNNNMLLLNV